MDRDLAHQSIEKMETEIDNLISRRHANPPLGEEELRWEETEKRYAAAREAASRLAWRDYHLGAIERHKAVLTSLIREHEEQVEKYEAQMIEDGKRKEA